MQKKIYELLNEIGVPQGIRGRDYLALAIEIVFKKGRIAIVKELYPEIASIFFVTPASVERNTRHAIEKTFDDGNISKIYKIFGSSISHKSGKLTNKTFIYGLVDYLKYQR